MPNVVGKKMELSNTNPEGTASPGCPTFLTMSCLYEMRKTWISCGFL